MAEVLGRVVGSELASPRGPDVAHRIRVPRLWLERGETLEFELPRHLSCAACEGGGCDACQRSGAVTLRGRQEPAEFVEVSLPRGARSEPFVIRIPGRGGLPPEGSALPRGHLLLKVEPSASERASASVAVVGRTLELSRRLSLSVKVPRANAALALRLALGLGFLLALAALIGLLTR